jgi:hypothetical protein
MSMRLVQKMGDIVGWIRKTRMPKAWKRTILGCLLCLGVLLSGQVPVYASEGASSDYFPGAFASFAVAVTPDPGAQFVNQTLYYHGKVNKAVVKNATVFASLEATAVINYFGGGYTFETPVLDGRLQLFAAVPVGYVNTKVGLAVPPYIDFDRSDRAVNLGDSLMTGSLFWDAGDLHFKFMEMVVAPTGAYSKHDLANVGRNYWAYDTSLAATWLSSKTGTEVSVMPGIMFNDRNPSTDYDTGNEFHMDFMVNQYLSKSFALGAQGYWYKQVSEDTGDGAVIPHFKAESYGFGPALLWVPGGSDGKLSLIGKWLFDAHHENRMRGDYGQLVFAYKF